MRGLSLLVALVAVIVFLISIELKDTSWLVGAGMLLVIAAIINDVRTP